MNTFFLSVIFLMCSSNLDQNQVLSGTWGGLVGDFYREYTFAGGDIVIDDNFFGAKITAYHKKSNSLFLDDNQIITITKYSNRSMEVKHDGYLIPLSKVDTHVDFGKLIKKDEEQFRKYVVEFNQRALLAERRD